VAVADLAGGEWAQRARKAAHVLTAEAERADTGASMSVRLLADLRHVFTMRAPDGSPVLNEAGQVLYHPGLFTDLILSDLHAIPEAPWGSYYGRQLSPGTWLPCSGISAWSHAK
jgi:Protein of unknown function (DUF3631)